jgi:hypothetical protein
MGHRVYQCDGTVTDYYFSWMSAMPRRGGCFLLNPDEEGWLSEAGAITAQGRACAEYASGAWNERSKVLEFCPVDGFPDDIDRPRRID